ncbi:MAG: NAAT family transporter [Candidatus Kinetoplastibacterium crithidii]|nr:NAAT family transporter [Candidatus Kinetoplastibacterium crithidii]
MIDPLIKSFLFTLATLLPFLNPPAIAPIFLSMTEGASPETRLMLAKKVGINVAIMLISTMLVGNGILMLFGISLPIVRLGGGMLIMYSAWNLVTAADDNNSSDKDNQANSMSLEAANSRSFYPLTFPVTFGPGAIAGAITVGVSLIDEQLSIMVLRLSGAIPAILLATFALYICMKFSAQMLNKLGKSGTAVFMRLSAFIMLCLGVQICWVGIQGLVNTFL